MISSGNMVPGMEPGSISPFDMPEPTPQKSYLLGGIVLCAFPATLLAAMHFNGVALPMPWPIFFGVVFVYGVRSLMVSLLGLDLEGAASWIADAIAAGGFAAFAFWIAWSEKDGWAGGVPFLPDGWNQNIARAFFAGGGIVCMLFAGRCVLKACRVYRNVPDEGMGHKEGIEYNDGTGDA